MTAAKTREDYERDGFADARAGIIERTDRKSSSWQARAYWRGFDGFTAAAAKTRAKGEGTTTGRFTSASSNIPNTPKSPPSVLRVLGPLYGPRSKPKNLFNRKQA